MKNKKLITTYLILISFSLFSVSVYAKTLMIGDDNADITHFFGKVGIGTASPQAKLTVHGTTKLNVFTTGGTEFTDWPEAGLSIRRIDDYTHLKMLQFGHSADATYQTGDAVWNFDLVDEVGNKATSSSNTDLKLAGPGDLVLSPAGNVGIGATTPTSKLDVAGTGNFTGTVTVGTPTADGHATNRSWVQSYVAGSSGIGGLGSTYVNQTGDTMSGILNMGNNAITNINWATSDDGSGSGLDADTIDGHNYSTNWETTGDITGITNGTGITGGCTSGTCTLNATLGTQITEDEIAQNTLDDSEIQDNSLTAGSLAANSVGNSELIDSPTFTGITSGTGNFSGNLTMSGTAANIVLGSNWLSGDGGDEGVFVDSAGKVGIGTASPGAVLDVNSVNQPVAKFTTSGTGDWLRGIQLFNVGIASGNEIMLQIGKEDSSKNTGQVYFHYAGDSSTDNRLSFGLYAIDDVLNILGTGNVGIGTTTPGEKLSVAGNVLATAFLYSSDRTLKKDILTIDNSLNKIKQLEGVSFKWKNEKKGKGVNLGLIAQDVEKVFPEIVRTDKKTGLKSVQYGNIVAPLIEAVKEMDKKVEDLFNKYINQQEQIDNLEIRNNELKIENDNYGVAITELKECNKELINRIEKLEKLNNK